MIYTLKVPRALLILPLVLLAGCTEFMEGYNDAKLHAGEPGYSFSERLARVGDAVVQTATATAGAYARGYAQASQTYQATHPTEQYQSPPPTTTLHSGLIFGPNGQTSMYHINDDGYGAVYGPNGQTTTVTPHALYGPNGQTTIISGN
jgi:hypothetical protein